MLEYLLHTSLTWCNDNPCRKNEKREYTNKSMLILEVEELFIKYLYNSDKGFIIRSAYEFSDEATESTRTIVYKDRAGVVGRRILNVDDNNDNL